MQIREGVEYLTDEEVEQQYGWNYNQLSYFQKKGFISSQFFLGERKRYWMRQELNTLKDMPPIKRGPKPDALNSQCGTTSSVAASAGEGLALGRLIV